MKPCDSRCFWNIAAIDNKADVWHSTPPIRFMAAISVRIDGLPLTAGPRPSVVRRSWKPTVSSDSMSGRRLWTSSHETLNRRTSIVCDTAMDANHWGPMHMRSIRTTLIVFKVELDSFDRIRVQVLPNDFARIPMTKA